MARARAGVGVSAVDRRDPVADPGRLAMAGRAGAVRPWQTVYGLFRRWQRAGVWRAVVSELQARADAAGLRIAAHLDRNDAYGFFEPLGDLVVTGPTHTNVNDFRALLIL